MALVAWKVTFQFQLDEDENWQSDSAISIGGEDGGKIINDMIGKMLNSEVVITVGNPAFNLLHQLNLGGDNQTKKTITNWRPVGLEMLGKVNFFDMEALAAAGAIELDQKDQDDEANPKQGSFSLDVLSNETSNAEDVLEGDGRSETVPAGSSSEDAGEGSGDREPVATPAND